MKKILAKFAEKNLTLGSVESMTGGLFAACFTSVPGASKVFKGSIVSYSCEVKNNVVGVDKKNIEKYGVVSAEVAKEMAEKGRKLLGVDVCVSVTGNAGPTAEPGSQPVGCFFVGIAEKNGVKVEKFYKKGKRNTVRNKAVLAMRDLLH